jgi:hypothetical protein
MTTKYSIQQMPANNDPVDTSYAQPALAQPLLLKDTTNTDKKLTNVEIGTSDSKVDAKNTKRKRDYSSVNENRRIVKAKRVGVHKVSRNIKHGAATKRARFLSPKNSKQGRTSLLLARLASPNTFSSPEKPERKTGESNAASRVCTPPGFRSMKSEMALPPPGFTPKHFDPSTYRRPLRSVRPGQTKRRTIARKTPGRHSTSTLSLVSNVTGPFDLGFSSGILFPMHGKDTSVSSPKPKSAVPSPYRFGSLLSPMLGKDSSVSSPKQKSAVSSPYCFGSLLSPMFGKDTSASSPKPKSAVLSRYRFGSTPSTFKH